jgi:hypothetical protein
MNTDSNVLSNNTNVHSSDIKNVGFALLDQLFKQHGWHLIKNEMNRICYTKFAHETDVFDIKIEAKSIRVSVPVNNSPFQYVNLFDNYYQASEYVEMRFLDFISQKKIETENTI